MIALLRDHLGIKLRIVGEKRLIACGRDDDQARFAFERRDDFFKLERVQAFAALRTGDGAACGVRASVCPMATSRVDAPPR